MADLNRIDHIAMVVEDLEQSLVFWRDQLGLEVDHVDTVESMQVRIAFLPMGDSQLELVQPTGEESGVARFLKKRGPGLHHICIEVDDLSGKLQSLKKEGVKLIDEQPVVMEDGRQLAFIHPRGTGGVLLELYQLPR